VLSVAAWGAAAESGALGSVSAGRTVSAFAGVSLAVAASVFAPASVAAGTVLEVTGSFGSGPFSTVDGVAVCALIFGDRGIRAGDRAAGGIGAFAPDGLLCG
jgi:hypothetical protein